MAAGAASRQAFGPILPGTRDVSARFDTPYQPGGAVPLAETLDALMEAKARGLTRHIGVSNFNTTLLQEAIAVVGAAQIVACSLGLWLAAWAWARSSTRRGPLEAWVARR